MGRTGEVGGFTCRSRMVGQGRWVGSPVGSRMVGQGRWVGSPVGAEW